MKNYIGFREFTDKEVEVMTYEERYLLEKTSIFNLEINHAQVTLNDIEKFYKDDIELQIKCKQADMILNPVWKSLYEKVTEIEKTVKDRAKEKTE